MLSDRLQTYSEWFRVGQEQHRQGQQPQGIPAQPLRESPDASIRSIPRIFHDSVAELLELQLHGCSARADDEVRPGVGQPERILSRSTPTFAFPQFRKFGRSDRMERIR